MVFNQRFGGGKEEPRQLLQFQSGFSARPLQFATPSSETAPSPGRTRHPTASPQARGGWLQHITMELEELMLQYLKPLISSPQCGDRGTCSGAQPRWSLALCRWQRFGYPVLNAICTSYSIHQIQSQNEHLFYNKTHCK